MIKKIALLIIILLMAIPVVAREQKPKDTLVVAISKDFEPFTFLNAEGKPAGMFVDMWRLWAQKTGKQIEFISSDWKTSLENLKNQKADIHSGFLYSPEHFKWISGSQPFYEVGVSLFYPLKRGKISDINELSGQTVSTIRGSQLEQFLKKHYPDIRVYPCDTIEELVRVTREGKAKGFIAIWPVGAAVIDRMGLSGEFKTYGKTLYKEIFLSGVLKNNTELLALVDKGLNAISYQEYAEIEARWIPDPAQRYYKTSKIIQLTPQEETWLKNHKTIRVGISPVFPPLKFSEKGVIKGIEPDYLNLLSEYTGIRFEYIICDLSVMDAKVKSGEMDMFISFYIPERLTYMMFTEPLMEFKQVIIARKDAPFMSGIGALKGKKVAAARGVKLYDKLFSPYPEIEVVQVDTMEEMFKAVSEFKADALISRTYIAGYVMQNYPNLKIAGIANLPPEPYYYAVRKDYPELVSILNKAIASIPREKHDAIVQKWFSVRFEYRPNWSEILKWAFVIGGAFAIILGLALVWNRRLAREIDKCRQVEEHLRYVNRLYATLSQVNQAIVRTSEPEKLFGEICQIAIEFGQFKLAWIGLVNEQSGEVRPVAAHGMVRYLDNIRINIHDLILGAGPTGRAIRGKASVIVSNIQDDPKMRPWHDAAVKYGFLSIVAIPLRQEERVIGALNLYASEPNFFSTTEIELLEEVANDISYALDAMESEMQRKQTEETLKESEERYRAFVKQSSEAICMFEIEDVPIDTTLTTNEQIDLLYAHAVIRECNRTFATSHGFDEPTEMLGLKIGQVFPLLAKENVDYLRHFIQGGNNISGEETKELTRDGSIKYFLNSLSGHVENNSLVRIWSVKQDISRIKQAEEEIRTLNTKLEQRVFDRTAQLEAANKELEAFSYSVSHDLRAPLRAVDGYTQMLLEDFGPRLDAEGRRVCYVISESARNMGKLIDDLLAFSRTGRAAITPSLVDMATLAKSIFFELTTPEDRGRINFSVGSLPLSLGDPALIRQVWMNLLGNAIKFSSKKEHAAIEIGCVSEGSGLSAAGGSELIYFVRDNGAGFDMQYVEKLFGVFQRLHSAKEFEGTGVGLAIVQRIIHRHGGRIWAEGAVDEGATFYFTLQGSGSRG